MIVARTPIFGSDALTEVAYHFQEQRLEVTYTGGSTYAYAGVPVEVYEKLMTASSKGGFVSAHIKDHFPVTQALV
jgi:hypothetical protein